eukprot:11199071-Lingulodinium_polyedra.AAC.1
MWCEYDARTCALHAPVCRRIADLSASLRNGGKSCTMMRSNARAGRCGGNRVRAKRARAHHAHATW